VTRLMQASFRVVAFDRASVRRVSPDGHLFIASSVVSRAEVSDYQGGEVPNYRLLGLQADKSYPILRDPIALEKAVPSLHGKPLVIVHRELTAASHDREIVVGSVQNPVFRFPDVLAELSVWDGDAIAMIESGEQAQLSCGYSYQPIRERGRYNGVPFELRMVNISFNHCALVSVARVSGASVGDSALHRKGANNMNENAKKALSALEKFLQEKMSDEDFAASSDYVTELMRCCSQNEDGGEMDDDEQAQDDPPEFRGKPRSTNMTGDRLAPVTAASRRSFEKLYGPGSSKVTHV
jgi:hypothetical protein